MEKYRIFCNGNEHVFICDSSVDYEHLKDFILDLLDINPQLMVINDSCTYLCHDMFHDNDELFSD